TRIGHLVTDVLVESGKCLAGLCCSVVKFSFPCSRSTTEDAFVAIDSYLVVEPRRVADVCAPSAAPVDPRAAGDCADACYQHSRLCRVACRPPQIQAPRPEACALRVSGGTLPGWLESLDAAFPRLARDAGARERRAGSAATAAHRRRIRVAAI